MSKPGPKSTPTKTLQLRGSWRGDIREGEPEPTTGNPDKPEYLTDLFSETWDRLVGQIESMGLLTEVDGWLIERYCVAWVRWREAEKYIADNGMTYESVDNQGNVTYKPYPQVKIANDLASQLNRLEAQFGLGPSNRVGLTVLKDKPVEKGKKRFFKGA